MFISVILSQCLCLVLYQGYVDVLKSLSLPPEVFSLFYFLEKIVFRFCLCHFPQELKENCLLFLTSQFCWRHFFFSKNAIFIFGDCISQSLTREAESVLLEASLPTGSSGDWRLHQNHDNEGTHGCGGGCAWLSDTQVSLHPHFHKSVHFNVPPWWLFLCTPSLKIFHSLGLIAGCAP